MRHVRDTELIRLAAGESEADDAARVQAHLETCAACRARHAEQVRLREMLGAWTVTPPGDVVANLRSRLAARDAAPRVIPMRGAWRVATRVARIAAAVVVGVGAGYGAAHFSAAPRHATESPPESWQDDPLGLRFLADASPVGLSAVLSDLESGDDASGDQP